MDLIDDLVASISKVTNDDGTSLRIVRQLTVDFGGEQLYLPKERTAFREDLDGEIYSEFNGCNVKELARRYGMTASTVYKIIKGQRARIASERIAKEKAEQGSLF